MRTARSLDTAHVGRATPDMRALPPVCQSGHARQRAAQRNLSATDMAYIMLWGHEVRRTGALFYCLRDKDIPAQHRHLPQIARLAGAVVLASRAGEVITLYRNAHTLRDIQRKMKYRFTPGSEVICADMEEEPDEADAADSLSLARGA
jgi:hypothetical protein